MKPGRFGLIPLVGLLIFAQLTLFACGNSESGSKDQGMSASTSRIISVQVAKAETTEVQVQLHSIGRLVSRNAPSLAAEIDARVVAVLVEEGEAIEKGQELVLLDTTATELARREARAEIERLKASIANEERRVVRYRDLKTRDMMPQERLDDAELQLAVYRASLQAAEARLAVAEDRLTKARLLSPFDGVVETRHVSVGDFASVGRVLITMTDTRSMWAQMPFPETVGNQLEVGLEVVIESLVAPGQVVETTIHQIRPQVGSMNRAVIAIADVTNPGPWRPEATIEATVVIERRPEAVVVPGLSVVSRPAGNVVYLYESGRVRQSVVETGEVLDGLVEIRSGLKAGDTVVTEGAHYLSDGAAVSVREPGS